MIVNKCVWRFRRLPAGGAEVAGSSIATQHPVARGGRRPVAVDRRIASKVFGGDLAGERGMIVPDDDSGGQVEEAFAPEKPHRGLIGVDVAAMLVAVFVGDARDDSRCSGQAVSLPSLFRERRVRGAVRSREGRGRSLSGTDLREVARYWAGLPLLVRLSEAGTELSSGEVGALLGTRSVKGIGAALSGTRDTLFAAGIRMDEAAIRRTVRGRSVWTGGPRIRQAIHVLEQERYLWTESGGRDVVPIEDARSGDPGPVLVLRALKSRGNVYRIDGGMAELDEILEDGRFEIGDARRESIGEIFVARIASTTASRTAA